jgi:hypothetical protein
MENLNEYNLGDMVELTIQIRKPKLKGIIIQLLGYNKALGDFVYLIYCFSFKPPKKIKWTHRSVQKIS